MKPSTVPPNVLSYAPVLLGKLLEYVSPTTYKLLPSFNNEYANSLLFPPTYVDASKVVKSVLIFVTKTSLFPPLNVVSCTPFVVG